MRDIDTLIIHCSATPPSMDVGVETIRKWHTDPKPAGRGWADVGYHFVIRRDGRIEKGRPTEVPGAHAKGANASSIGICLIGGVDEDGKPDCNFTRSQWEVLGELVDDLFIAAGPFEVIGHREVSDKACPSFDVAAWMQSP